MSDEGIEAGLSNALFSVILTHEGRTVGCGRIVGDGGLYFYLQDVIVAPEHQGRGLGAKIVSAAMGYLERTCRPGAFVGLMAADDVEGFYERYGFRRRPDRQPGMYLVWGGPEGSRDPGQAGRVSPTG